MAQIDTLEVIQFLLSSRYWEDLIKKFSAIKIAKAGRLKLEKYSQKELKDVINWSINGGELPKAISDYIERINNVH